MKDVFHEQIIERKKTVLDRFIQVGSVFLVILIIFLIFILSPFLGVIGSFAPILILGAGYGAYQIVIRRNIEYEYLITNGEIDVDRILNKSMRKRMITFQTDNIEDIGFYNKASHEHQKYGKIFEYCENLNSKETVYIIYPSKDHGKVQILLSPNEEILDSITKYLPRHLKEKMKKA